MGQRRNACISHSSPVGGSAPLRTEPMWRRIYREDSRRENSGLCVYCRTKLDRSEATADHVVPRAKGGRTTAENIVAACHGCNQAKGTWSIKKYKIMLRADHPPALDEPCKFSKSAIASQRSLERLYAWMRFRVGERAARAERRLRKFCGLSKKRL